MFKWNFEHLHFHVADYLVRFSETSSPFQIGCIFFKLIYKSSVCLQFRFGDLLSNFYVSRIFEMMHSLRNISNP